MKKQKTTQSHFITKDFLPTTRAEMDALGWKQCDDILVSGDDYIDSPFIGVAMVGRMIKRKEKQKAIVVDKENKFTTGFAS